MEYLLPRPARFPKNPFPKQKQSQIRFASINMYNSFQQRLPFPSHDYNVVAGRFGGRLAEILSWLPVESVLRFKCVCKKWGQLIQQNDFVEKHLRRSAMGCYDKKEYINLFRQEFYCNDMQKGLLLEQEYCNGKVHTGRLYIRNPATRQRVYLPDLQVGNESPTWVVARMYFVAKSINECTVISFSQSKESVLSGQFRAVTVGVDAAWRPLKNSPHNSMQCISNASGGPKIFVFVLSIEKIFHVVTIDRHEGNIMSVDAEDKSIKTTKIPENLFSNWRSVFPREWNSKLSLFSDGGDQINPWVLMNNNKNQWTKIQTIDLETPAPQDVYAPSFTFVNEFVWSIHRQELSIKPSILQLKGMQSESGRSKLGRK